MQELRRAPSLEDGCQFPAQIEAVLHGHIHALPSFRTVRMAGVTSYEHTRRARPDLLLRHVVELGEGTHTIMMEKNRMQFFREVMNFLNESDPLALN
jgi:hypothetical protein